jgi:hemolysin III
MSSSPPRTRSALCQSVPEEVTNSILHGIGALLSVAGLVILVLQSIARGDIWRLVGSSIFGASLVLLYVTSCLYHAFHTPKLKRVFQVLDHGFIFILIAGTYTPFVLGPLRNPFGWTLFGIVWGLAAAGVVLKALLPPRFEKPTSVLYLAMGWLICVALPQILQKVPHLAVVWLVIGGVAYTAGLLFFLLERRVRFFHAVWHVFVLAGSISNFFAVLYGVVRV